MDEINLDVFNLHRDTNWLDADLKCIFQENFETRGKILIFSSPQNIVRLFASKEIMIDGTFKCPPRLYIDKKGQLLGLHANIGDVHSILVWALLPGKSKEMYKVFFRFLRKTADDCNIRIAWQRLISDFELPMMNSFSEEFCRFIIIILFGCWFHYCQCIYRQIQKRKTLLGLYLQPHSSTRKFFRKTMALVHFPKGKIPMLFEASLTEYKNSLVGASTDMNTEIETFAEYFRRQWLYNPQLPIERWSAYETETNTTSPAEGFHMHLNQSMKCGGRLETEFIPDMKDIHNSQNFRLEQANHGQAVTRGRSKKTKDKYIKIRRILTSNANYLDSADNSHIPELNEALWRVAKVNSAIPADYNAGDSEEDDDPVDTSENDPPNNTGYDYEDPYDYNFYDQMTLEHESNIALPLSETDISSEHTVSPINLLRSSSVGARDTSGVVDLVSEEDDNTSDGLLDTALLVAIDKTREALIRANGGHHLSVKNGRIKVDYNILGTYDNSFKYQWRWEDFNRDDCVTGAIDNISTILRNETSVRNEFVLTDVVISLSIDASGQDIAIDLGGVFKTITCEISQQYQNYKYMNFMPLFTSNGFPGKDNAAQNSRVFMEQYKIFGIYLGLVLLQNGAWPQWLNKAVLKFLCYEPFVIDDLAGTFAVPGSESKCY